MGGVEEDGGGGGLLPKETGLPGAVSSVPDEASFRAIPSEREDEASEVNEVDRCAGADEIDLERGGGVTFSSSEKAGAVVEADVAIVVA